MQLVVVMAVTKAVRAATMTFTTISMMFFFLLSIGVRFKDFRFDFVECFAFQISDFRFLPLCVIDSLRIVESSICERSAAI